MTRATAHRRAIAWLRRHSDRLRAAGPWGLDDTGAITVAEGAPYRCPLAVIGRAGGWQPVEALAHNCRLPQPVADALFMASCSGPGSLAPVRAAMLDACGLAPEGAR